LSIECLAVKTKNLPRLVTLLLKKGCGGVESGPPTGFSWSYKLRGKDGQVTGVEKNCRVVQAFSMAEFTTTTTVF
jgi:hypothetical protein